MSDPFANAPTPEAGPAAAEESPATEESPVEVEESPATEESPVEVESIDPATGEPIAPGAPGHGHPDVLNGGTIGPHGQWIGP